VSGFAIVEAESAPRLATATALILEYAEWLGIDLYFQGFAEELAGLPGKFARPHGRLLLAEVGSEAAAVAALRRLEPDICEMKRLYVRPDFRGLGLGAALVDRLIGEARAIGYRAMRLDTFPDRMGAALVLYRARGFREIPAYYDNPFPGAAYLELDLA
jgi:GNAT superfamily N-acetyltransferase